MPLRTYRLSQRRWLTTALACSLISSASSSGKNKGNRLIKFGAGSFQINLVSPAPVIDPVSPLHPIPFLIGCPPGSYPASSLEAHGPQQTVGRVNQARSRPLRAEYAVWAQMDRNRIAPQTRKSTALIMLPLHSPHPVPHMLSKAVDSVKKIEETSLYFFNDYVKGEIVCQCPTPYSMLYGVGHLTPFSACQIMRTGICVSFVLRLIFLRFPLAKSAFIATSGQTIMPMPDSKHYRILSMLENPIRKHRSPGLVPGVDEAASPGMAPAPEHRCALHPCQPVRPPGAGKGWRPLNHFSAWRRRVAVPVQNRFLDQDDGGLTIPAICPLADST
jgi:hypothetical protein